MNVGFVGLGKLGLPVAYAMAARGLDVYGYDPYVEGPPEDTSHEQGFAETIAAAGDRMRFAPLAEVVDKAQTIFVAVQTPHDPRFEGITPLPADRADFDYSHLTKAVRDIVAVADRPRTLAVVSTVLPGTMAARIEPLLPDHIGLVYTPSFIAMGTTIRDFLDPEFVLLGGDDEDAAVEVSKVYANCGLGGGIIRPMSVADAELTKVAYNTFIGLKLAFANTLMEVCHKTGCDVDEVTGTLRLAHRRLISGAYLDGGMGDGGGCHPRDNIALSWLARELDLSYDLFEAAMLQRERQSRWLADLMCEHDLPKGILGVAYKPGSAITTGSPALLVKALLEDAGHPVDVWDPEVHNDVRPTDPHVFLVGCKHDGFPGWELPPGSVVIDPWRYIPDRPGIEVIRVGEGECAVPHDRQAREGRGVPARAA